MSAFIDSQAALFDATAQTQLPQVDAWRKAALAQAVRVGFPHNKLERWKYAPLRALATKTFNTSSPASLAVTAVLPPTPRLVFIDGHYAPEQSDLSGAEGLQISTLGQAMASKNEQALAILGHEFNDLEAPFSSLNTALAQDGVLIHTPAGHVLDAPLHLVFLSSENNAGSAYLRHHIECGEHSRLTVIEHHHGQGAGLSNALCQIRVASHAHLQHIRIQDAGSTLTAFYRCDAVLAADAEYTRLDVDTGNHYQRLELNLLLQGHNARARSGGVLWADGNSTLDTRLRVQHQAPDTACELLWRGLADDKGKVHFFGGIGIDAGADGSNAALSNKNLLLSAKAQITTQPALEIYADEVKAAHGATVGQLDNNALFYLRSRGVPEAEATALLTRAFYAEALALISDPNLCAIIQSFLPEKLALESSL